MPSMDGLLVIDKPSGPSSHDVVVRARRLLGQRRIGHTGTLDPAAKGVLPLVIGRATRLARFLAASDKSYEAVVRLGVSTTTGDAEGDRMGPAHAGALPSLEAIDSALDAFRGTFLQQPPAFSAKRVGGKRSYMLARAAVHSLPDPVSVTAYAIRVLGTRLDGEITLQVDCSAGFYIRSLAHDLGVRLETGAYLESLRRTRSGEFTGADAIALSAAERDPLEAARRVIPLSRLLTRWSFVVLTSDGVRRATNGRDLGPADWVSEVSQGERECGSGPDGGGGHTRQPIAPRPAGVGPREQVIKRQAIRLVSQQGDLVGIAEPAATPGLLHPFVVLV